jgi:flagellin
MALTVATNTGALMAQAAASSVNKEMEVAMERLSTGKRINGAADDAAGVAIASRLTAEIRGTNQAIRNAMDGQALIDTAEGAHEEVEHILQRMRELAVQASNDTNDSDDRSNLNTELTALVAELDRIADTTSWAGQTLLDGTFATNGVNIHVGSRTATADTITHTIDSIDSDALNFAADTSTTATVASIVLGSTQVSLTEAAGTFTATLDAAGNAALTTTGNAVATGGAGSLQMTTAGANAENVTVAVDGISVSVALTGAQDQTVTSADGAGNSASGLTTSFATNVLTVTREGDQNTDNTVVTVGSVSVTLTSAGNAASAAAEATAFTADLNADAAFAALYKATDNSDGTISITDADSVVLAAQAAEINTALNADATFSATHSATVSTDTVTIAKKAVAGNITFSVDSTAVSVTLAGGETVAQIGAAVESAMDSALGARYTFTDNSDGTVDIVKAATSAIALDTRANAILAIDSVDAAITTISAQRAELGSVSNRLDSTVSNLTNISANLQAGRGRIEDADFAAETTSLAKSQILQQASTAMLAQANASKQNVLSLLQG